MSQIAVSNLTFAYPGSYDTIFENASFVIDTTWKTGFIGRNGRGKTTFLHLLQGNDPFQGSIHASVDFSLFPFPIQNPKENTKALLQGLCPKALEWQLLRELSQLAVKEEVLERSFDTLSPGEQTKALLAGLFLRENAFLLIDEPTNHLDMEGRAVVSRYLFDKSGFLLVSHDRAFLDGCIDHVLSIDRCRITVQKGNFSTWQQNKELEDAFQQERNRQLQKDIQRLEEASLQAGLWSDQVESSKKGFRQKSGSQKGSGKIDRGYIGQKSAKMRKRAKNIIRRQQDAIAEKSSLLKNVERADSLKLFPQAFRKSDLFYMEEVSLFYGDRRICHNLSFQMRSGDRIALQGKNGSGKSSLLHLILEEAKKREQGSQQEAPGKTLAKQEQIPPERGETSFFNYTGIFQKGSGLRISYVPQSTAHLRGSLQEYAKIQGIDQSQFMTILRKLDFSRLQLEKDLASYSGGQKKKVLIAASLCQEAHLYIWDEPLNYIDLLSRIQIEELLLEFKPTLLFVEHDKTFCDRISTGSLRLSIEKEEREIGGR